MAVNVDATSMKIRRHGQSDPAAPHRFSLEPVRPSSTRIRISSSTRPTSSSRRVEVYAVQSLRQQASSYTRHAGCLAAALRATLRLHLGFFSWLDTSSMLSAPHGTNHFNYSRPATASVWISRLAWHKDLLRSRASVLGSTAWTRNSRRILRFARSATGYTRGTT